MTKEILSRRVQEGGLLTRETEEDWISPKSDWGEGPWTTEPDDAPFEHAGFRCLVLRTRFGSFTGMVAVPPGHPWHGKQTDQLSAPVHGGLSFSEPAWTTSINEVHFEDSEKRDHWWVGFDASRMGDLCPALRAYEERTFDTGGPIPRGTYRTLVFMCAETEKLAEEADRVARVEGSR